MGKRKLNVDFYRREDVLCIARELLGKVLVTNIGGIYTSGMITETEAYAGIGDKGSHAWNGRRTVRNEVMYGEPGTAYIYLCYGIHHLFNVVTNEKDIPHAVLIRGIKPLDGLDAMLKRRGLEKTNDSFGNGPGKISKALGLHTKFNGERLTENKIWIEDHEIPIDKENIRVTPRIGIEYAGEDALLPYRFLI